MNFQSHGPPRRQRANTACSFTLNEDGRIERAKVEVSTQQMNSLGWQCPPIEATLGHGTFVLGASHGFPTKTDVLNRLNWWPEIPKKADIKNIQKYLGPRPANDEEKVQATQVSRGWEMSWCGFRVDSIKTTAPCSTILLSLHVSVRDKFVFEIDTVLIMYW